MGRRPWGGAVAFLAALLAGARAGDVRLATVHDLVYARPAGSPPLRLDLAYPLGGRGPSPAVVVFYGGAWRTGNKWGQRPLLDELARRGFVAVAPQYRHCPRFPFPAQVDDARLAVAWIREHASELGGDPDRVATFGFSSGAHLALMVGLDDHPGPTDLRASARVRAVVNVYGPTDLAAADLSTSSQALIRDFLGARAVDRPDLAARASPLTYVTPDDPPVLTLHGTLDDVVPISQADRLDRALARHGVTHRLVRLDGLGHGFPPARHAKAMQVAFDFLAETLRPGAGMPTTR